jgi:hypothetical protein
LHRIGLPALSGCIVAGSTQFVGAISSDPVNGDEA